MQIYQWRGEIITELYFIQAEVKGKRTSYMMVDYRSAINVCPLQILPNLGVKVGELTKSNLVIRAYDDSTRSVEGTFVAPMKTGPIEAVVEFIVLDIPVPTHCYWVDPGTISWEECPQLYIRRLNSF